MHKSMEAMLTLDEAAKVLRLSKSKLYLERKAGRLRTIRFGGVVRVRNEDLRRYVTEAARRSM